MESESKKEAEVYQTFELSDGTRTVTILATKEEEERINQDQDYATQRFLSAVGEYNAVEEVDDDFNHNATLLLIECVRDRFKQFSLSRQDRNQVYKEIQDELRSYSYNLSVEKIRHKWNNLVTTYRRIKDRHKAGSMGRRVWDYFQPIDEFLGPKYEPGGNSNVATNSRTNQQQKQQSSPAHTFIIKTTSQEPSLSPVSGTTSAISHNSSHSASSKCFVRELKRRYSETEFDEQVDKSEKRQEMIEQYLQQLKETRTTEETYRKRKERRDRMKLRALQNIGKELESISRIQSEILSKQNLLYGALSKSKNTK